MHYDYRSEYKEFGEVRGGARISGLSFFEPGWDWMDYPQQTWTMVLKWGPAIIDARFINEAIIDKYVGETDD